VSKRDQFYPFGVKPFVKDFDISSAPTLTATFVNSESSGLGFLGGWLVSMKRWRLQIVNKVGLLPVVA